MPYRFEQNNTRETKFYIISACEQIFEDLDADVYTHGKQNSTFGNSDLTELLEYMNFIDPLSDGSVHHTITECKTHADAYDNSDFCEMKACASYNDYSGWVAFDINCDGLWSPTDYNIIARQLALKESNHSSYMWAHDNTISCYRPSESENRRSLVGRHLLSEATSAAMNVIFPIKTSHKQIIYTVPIKTTDTYIL